ncbi:hypothetical protein AAG570_013958 [Ranatra chinensis]|uniref:C2H2-type domain-containing protein n=1 Tax=Ranatra chinensis TaxID=642074 RepID=A0ABD0YQA3_9HEMI
MAVCCQKPAGGVALPSWLWSGRRVVPAGLAWSSGPPWPEKRFICPQCGRRYRWKQTLSRHLRLECGKEPTFQCPHCPHKAKRKKVDSRKCSAIFVRPIGNLFLMSSTVSLIGIFVNKEVTSRLTRRSPYLKSTEWMEFLMNARLAMCCEILIRSIPNFLEKGRLRPQILGVGWQIEGNFCSSGPLEGETSRLLFHHLTYRGMGEYDNTRDLGLLSRRVVERPDLPAVRVPALRETPDRSPDPEWRNAESRIMTWLSDMLDDKVLNRLSDLFQGTP